MRILVADDVPSNRIALSLMLSKFGQCTDVESGEETIKVWEEARRNGVPFDLLCIDFVMPGLSGDEIVRHIRKAEEAAGFAATRIVVVSTLDDKEALARIAANGDVVLLEKPVSVNAIERALRELDLL